MTKSNYHENQDIRALIRYRAKQLIKATNGEHDNSVLFEIKRLGELADKLKELPDKTYGIYP